MNSHTDQVQSAARVDTTDAAGGVLVVRVSGDVDAATRSQITTEVGALIDSRPTAIVLDLRAVEFLGSVGIAMLVNGLHHAARLGVGYTVVADNRSVLRPLRATQMDVALPLHATVEGALAAIGHVPG